MESEDNPVYIRDVTGRSITAANVNENLRVTGTLSSPTACGAEYLCYPLNHGAGEPVALRTNSDFVEIGSCVTFVGPLSVYEGTPQLSATNYDWLWVNHPNE